MRTIIFFALLVCFATVMAAEKKSLRNVDVNALTAETQVLNGGGSEIDLAWWIPSEYWEASMRSSPDVQEFQITQVLDVLRPYSVVAVVQANISQFGAFSFFDEDAISGGMLIEFIDENGNHSTLSHKTKVAPDVVILLNQMVPILSAAMGNMGQNFYFFPLPDVDADGNRLVSPYKKGIVRITLNTRENEEPVVLDIELPLDSLHIPRLCPNGKHAHVSWNYCPWGGEKLKD